jgi:hypothetical protein
VKFSSSSSLRQVLGWSVLVRVDNLTYWFLGDGSLYPYNGTVNFTSIAVTPTQTVLTAQAGHMQVNLTFLNPIEVRFHSSVTFNVYMRIIVSPKIGSSNPSHSHTWLSPRTPLTAQATLCRCIQMSPEVRAVVLRNPSLLLSLVTEWNSGNRSHTILWNSTSNADVIFHSVSLQTPAVFTEIIDQAEWGALYYAMKAVRDSYQLTFLLDDLVMSMQGDNVTYQIAWAVDSRGKFSSYGELNDQQDPNPRAISDNSPVFAISHDIGTVKATQAPVVWTVGYTTDPAISYTDLSGAPPISRSLYYKTQYSNDEALASINCNSFGR